MQPDATVSAEASATPLSPPVVQVPKKMRSALATLQLGQPELEPKAKAGSKAAAGASSWSIWSGIVTSASLEEVKGPLSLSHPPTHTTTCLHTNRTRLLATARGGLCRTAPRVVRTESTS